MFGLLRYDNLKSAVKKILRGYRREETARFIAFRSHWRFTSEFCSPYEAHEKRGIESEAGYFRRNRWVPLPKARDLEDLNGQPPRHLAEAADLIRARSTIIELGKLSRYERPQPSLNDYDALLDQKVAS